MTAVASQLDLDALNTSFENAHPSAIIQWAVRQFAHALVMSSSFGAESALLIHLAISVKPDIKIVFGDTGYLFPETYQFMEQLRQRFNLNVWTYRTRNDPIAYLRQAGEDDPRHRKDIDACCAANKNELFTRAMRELTPKAWLRGIRRDQNKLRGSAQFVTLDPTYGACAISPLLNWSGRDIHAYMKQHDLPYHPLVAKGYLSIGCNPLSCTRPVQDGEDPRSGRWAGRNKDECGINLGSLDNANQI